VTISERIISCSRRTFAFSDAVESRMPEPVNIPSSSSLHVHVWPTSSVVGSNWMYAAQKEASPSARSCMSSIAIARYSLSESGITLGPSTRCAASRVMTSSDGTRTMFSPCTISLRAMSPRPQISKSSTVSLSTRSGCAAFPQPALPDIHTPLDSSHFTRAPSRTRVESAAPPAAAGSLRKFAAGGGARGSDSNGRCTGWYAAATAATKRAPSVCIVCRQIAALSGKCRPIGWDEELQNADGISRPYPRYTPTPVAQTVGTWQTLWRKRAALRRPSRSRSPAGRSRVSALLGAVATVMRCPPHGRASNPFWLHPPYARAEHQTGEPTAWVM
jgi:hypothetical protein